MDTMQPAFPDPRTWRLGIWGTLEKGIATGAVVGWVYTLLGLATLTLVERFDFAAVLRFMSDAFLYISLVSVFAGVVVGALVAIALWIVFSILPQSWLGNHRLAGGIVGLVVSSAISIAIFNLIFSLESLFLTDPNSQGGIQDQIGLLVVIFIIPCILVAIIAALSAGRYYTVSMEEITTGKENQPALMQ